MKTVLGIVARDLKALLRNPIALLVVGALMVLPGLYAWYCIVANWDPYANTGRMPIAVVNEDKGAAGSLTGDVNIGEQVVEKLHGNDSIDWRFYDSEEEALEATRLLECYATIVLPADLSENVIGIFEGSNAPPTIYYYPNEKQNAVATKVSDSAAQTLVRQVNQQFASTVNETLLKAIQRVSHEAEEKAGEAHASALSEVRSVQDDIDRVIASLDDATSSIAGWKDAVAGSQNALVGAAQQLPAIRTALTDGGDDVDALRTQTSEFESRLAAALLSAGTSISSLSESATADIGGATADLSSVAGSVNEVIGALETLEPSLREIDPELADQVREILGSLTQTNEALEASLGNVGSSVRDMNADVQQKAQKTADASNTFSTQIMPQLSDGAYELSAALSGLSAAIAQFEPQIAELQSVLSQTDTSLDRAVAAIAEAKVLLADIGRDLKDTVTDLGALGSALQIDEVSELLDLDPDKLGQFVSSPVQMVTEEIYPVSNYGTAVAPFYTNLALWIGCFILISLMKVEVNPEGFEDATTTQRYFGRWLLFVILSLIQSQVICGVDILLGIDCAHPGLFMLAGAVCSFAYMNLIYALVITFRNIGKTLCILLLIMQVPGSSGMYPIQMMPSFFQFIHPALPFTYGIEAMREALCGLYGTTVVGDLLVLLGIVPVSLLIGLALRPGIMNLLALFDEEMRKTGFFASEEHGQAGDSTRVRGMMRALMSHDDVRDDFEARAWSFNRRYPRLRRIGSIATFIIPFAFLVVMLPFNLLGNVSINVKIGVIVAMLVVLLLVIAALIVLEYMHRMIAEETRLLGEQIMGDDLEDLLSYSTLIDQADEVRQAAEAEAELAAEQAADDLLAAAPPISSELLAMIPAWNEDAGASSRPAEARTQDEARVSPPRASARKKRKREGAGRDIFFTDMRLGFQSVVGVVVIMLLVITPSLYAWFNIAGSWDPYSNTGNLKVAVANTDEGYKGELIPVTINVGDTVVSQLRGNDSFDWTFVTADEATTGVTSGEYYAAIVIPPDFSGDMMTYLTEDAHYPDVVYYTNEKENPIAPIITQKGADSIQESIRETFTERVDEVGLTIAYDLLEYVTNPRVGSYVQKMSGHLDDALHDMGLGATELRTLSDLSSLVAGVVDTTGVALDGITAAGDSAKQAIARAEAGARNSDAAFNQATTLVEGLLAENGLDLSGVTEAIDSALSLLEMGASAAPGPLDGAGSHVDSLVGLLRNLEVESPDEQAVVDRIASSLGSLAASLHRTAENAGGIPADVEAARADLRQMADEAQAGVAEARSFYEGSMKPSIASLKSTMGAASDSTHSVVSGLEGAVSGLSGSTDGLSRQLTALSSGLSKAGGKLESAAKNLDDVKTRLAEALSSGDVRQMQAVLLGSDTTVLAERLAAPIQEDRQPLYPVANYGSSMAPFYTVLSLWVGALVMISTMRVHVVEERLEELRRRYTRVRVGHEFFGRYGIFGFISVLQSALVLLGDLFLLHIQCVHPVAFFLLGIFIGQVFCLFVYTLTELFGDVGKALCVILLIMQVAASGGTFPVEMLDPLLSSLVPFLPFFHGMTLLQECVAGIYWPTVGVSVGFLAIAVGLLLLVGVVIRRPFRKLNDFFEEQLEKTGYM